MRTPTAHWRNELRFSGCQSEQIVRFGGSPGLRDEGLLQSAVLRAENKVAYEPTASVATVAASLAWGLIKNHAFVDGNKRIGLASMVVFTELNGYHLTCTEVEETAWCCERQRARSQKSNGRDGWKASSCLNKGVLNMMRSVRPVPPGPADDR